VNDMWTEAILEAKRRKSHGVKKLQGVFYGIAEIVVGAVKVARAGKTVAR